MRRPAVVLLSGGLDSATVLALASRDGYAVHTLSFDYGQRHSTELRYAQEIAKIQGVESHRVFPLDLRAIGGSALTDENLAVPEYGAEEGRGIPPTYVPARNTVFLSIALAWAEVLGSQDIFVGVNSQDYSGYPDCRPGFVQAFEDLANEATRASSEGRSMRIHAPLQFLRKSEIIRLGEHLGVNYGLTRSCYQLDLEGRSCGRCDSCRLRREGFREAGIPDPTPYI